MAKKGNNILALGVGLDLNPLNNDIVAAAATAKDGMQQVANAVVGGSNKSGEATKQFGDKVQSMRAQLRQATQDTQMLADKYGVMDARTIASAAHAGELKDNIGDINTVITAFSADSKFTVVAGALQQAAGAASIVTGAMGLLGTESKETQEMLLKVQSALALTQGLASLKEAGAAFTALKAVIVGQVIPSIMAMEAATIVATGGAVVVLGLVTAAVMSYSNSLDEEAEALKRANEAQLANNKFVADSQQILIETQNLRTRAMAEGLQKELRLNKDKLAVELYENELARSQDKIGETSFQIRKAAITQFYQNEELKIRKDANTKKLAEDKIAQQKAIESLKVQFSDVAKIQSQFQGGNISMGTLTAPSMPTKTGLNEKESLAFKIKQESDKAYTEMMNFKVRMQEAGQSLSESISETLRGGISNAITGLGQLIGQSLTGSIQDPFAALGDLLLQSLGGVMTQLGTQMIAMGVGMLNLDIAIKSLNAPLAIAGGIALVAAGAAISSIASKGLKGGQTTPSNGGISSNANPSNFSNNNVSTKFMENNLVISGFISGNNIQLVNGRNDAKFGRSLRF